VRGPANPGRVFWAMRGRSIDGDPPMSKSNGIGHRTIHAAPSRVRARCTRSDITDGLQYGRRNLVVRWHGPCVARSKRPCRRLVPVGPLPLGAGGRRFLPNRHPGDLPPLCDCKVPSARRYRNGGLRLIESMPQRVQIVRERL
jgi:hypothetical protein